jgi:hypothetical protein
VRVVEDTGVSTLANHSLSEHAVPMTKPEMQATIQSERKTFSPVPAPAA